MQEKGSRFRSARSFLGLETSISTRHTYKILIVYTKLNEKSVLQISFMPMKHRKGQKSRAD